MEYSKKDQNGVHVLLLLKRYYDAKPDNVTVLPMKGMGVTEVLLRQRCLILIPAPGPMTRIFEMQLTMSVVNSL